MEVVFEVGIMRIVTKVDKGNKVLHHFHVQNKVLEKEKKIQVCGKIFFYLTTCYIPKRNTSNLIYNLKQDFAPSEILFKNYSF
jgi:hypothetical protein